MRDAMGLIGIYNASNYRDNVSSVYMISDASTSSLFVFVLFPGAFHDVYEIASLTMYQNVFIIPISVYPEYISDIYRLVMELTKIKTRVKVMSPDMLSPSIKPKLNSMFLNSLVKGTSKTTYVYSDNGFIAFDWNDEGGQAPSSELWPENYHDIYCTFSNTRILLTINKVDIDRIKLMLRNDLVDFVYIPWQNPSYTSTLFATFIDVFNAVKEMDNIYGTSYVNKLVIYGFPNDAAIELASEEYGNNFPINARSLFLNDAPVTDAWLQSLTFGNALLVATEDYHLTPTYCCCCHHGNHPVWPRPYNPMMYAPPIPPRHHMCEPGSHHDNIYICPHCGGDIIVKDVVVTQIKDAYVEVVDYGPDSNTDTTDETNDTQDGE